MSNDLLLAVASVAVGLVAFGRLARLSTSRVEAGTERRRRAVGLVIPARNEHLSIANLLSDIAGLTTQPSLVVVVNDHSVDNTASIASAFDFATVVDAPDLPAGWNGKPWACHVGANAAFARLADDDLLVFLDADVRLEPDALDALISEAATSRVVSVQPYHRAPAGVEQLSAMFNVVALMGVGAGWPAPTALFGPVICSSVSDYRSVGGHASVRREITEDVALGHRFLEHGIPVRVMGGGDAVGFRMYPAGFRSLVEGWSKNMATGAASIPRWRLAAVAIWICGLVSASIDYVGLVAGLTIGSASSSWASLAPVVVTGAGLAVLLRPVGSFRWRWIAAYPILVATFVLIFFRSAWRTFFRRSVTWRGRSIDLRLPVETDA